MKSSLVVFSLLFLATTGMAAPPEKPLYFGPHEKDFAAIERDVPGFAGWYFDGNGNVVIRMKDIARASEVIERVGRAIDAHPRGGRAAAVHGRPAMIGKPARYAFSELAEFRAAITANLPDDVHVIDLDEVENVVALFVSRGSSVGVVRSTAARLHIPEDALQVIVEPPAEQIADLYDYQRPLRGGYAFYLYINGSRARCTIGIPGKYKPYGSTQVQHGFVTASHCTQESFGGTGTIGYQPYYLAMARETVDSPAFVNSSPCDFGGTMKSPCRWSDAAFYEYDSTNAYDPAGIAVTSTIGDVGQPAPDPRDEVIGTQYATQQVQLRAVGDWLDKIGSTTGWTYGQVTRTCTHVLPGSSTVWRICQDQSSVFAQSGDSGSSVWVWYPDHVAWAGILWATNFNGTRSYHSPVWAVETDLPGFSRY